MIDSASTQQATFDGTIARCPEHMCSLHSGPDAWTCAVGGESFPVVDGIPILIADDDERRRIVGESPARDAGTAASFYNNAFADQGYGCVEFDDAFRDAIRAAMTNAPHGPTLEIGSGRGQLQGVREPYVALDYSLLALRSYVNPRFGRVCATAERLPFADASIAAIVSIDALEHVPRPDRAFAEIDRVLRPGGVAYLKPAWHCVQANCEGIPVRPYVELSMRQKLIKAALPVTNSGVFKALTTVPSRLLRRARWKLGGRPTTMRFGRLRPDYTKFWTADSDAISRLDAHEGSLFFASRGYRIASPGVSFRSQLLARHVALIVHKPVA